MADTHIQRSPLTAAQDDLRRLDSRIVALQEERAKIAAFIEMYGRYASPDQAAPQPGGLASGTPIPPAPPQFTGLALGRVLPMDERLPVSGLASGRPLRSMAAPLSIRIGNFLSEKMAQLEKPIPIGTIMEMLVTQNLIPGGKDPKQAVSAILGKDRRFMYRQNEGWSLVQPQTLRRHLEVE